MTVYFHNLKYDLEFMKGMLHQCEADGWKLEPTMRKGAVIKVRVSYGDILSIEFRDSMKKIPSDLKSIGKLVKLEK